MSTIVPYSSLSKWLANQPVNTADSPCNITISDLTDTTISDLCEIIDTAGRYLSIENLLGTFTSFTRDIFNGCEYLTSINIPTTITYIPYGSFAYCPNLRSIYIPDSITNICGKSFYSCTSLAEITLPKSITSLGTGENSASSNVSLFGNCISLQSITILADPSKITSYSAAFEDVEDYTNVIYVPSSYLTLWQSITASDWGLSSTDIFCAMPNNIVIDTIQFPGSSNSYNFTAQNLIAGGVAGQVLTSNGGSTPPSWQTPSIPVVINPEDDLQYVLTAKKSGNTVNYEWQATSTKISVIDQYDIIADTMDNLVTALKATSTNTEYNPYNVYLKNFNEVGLYYLVDSDDELARFIDLTTHSGFEPSALKDTYIGSISTSYSPTRGMSLTATSSNYIVSKYGLNSGFAISPDIYSLKYTGSIYMASTTYTIDTSAYVNPSLFQNLKKLDLSEASGSICADGASNYSTFFDLINLFCIDDTKSLSISSNFTFPTIIAPFVEKITKNKVNINLENIGIVTFPYSSTYSTSSNSSITYAYDKLTLPKTLKTIPYPGNDSNNKTGSRLFSGHYYSTAGTFYSSIYYSPFNCCTFTSIVIPDTVTGIYDACFWDSTQVINYRGTKEQWDAIDKASYNVFTGTVNYNYTD